MAEENAGLKGVVVGSSALSDVEEQGSLIYRGYDIRDLAEHATYEEVAHLLLKGKLPSQKELYAFNRELGMRRSLPKELVKAMELFRRRAHPMDMLRTSVSLLGCVEKNNTDTLTKAIDILAKMPALIANNWRLTHGKSYVAPTRSNGQAWNFLYMLKDERPDEDAVKLLDTTLILYAEHGFNASTFAARVTASTLSDIHAAITTGIGTLKGPLHGGANEKAMAMLKDIGSVEKAEGYVLKKLAEHEKIMGFGHREYKSGDPRAKLLKELGRKLTDGTPNEKWYRVAEKVEEVMMREKQLFPNVDFPCGYVYYALGIPIELYTPLFAMSRVAGWSAHILEQLENNTLIRPRSEYSGPRGLKYVAIAERKG